MTETAHPALRRVDFAAVEALAADQRYSQKLLDRKSGGDRVAVSLIRTPAGKGSPEGLHAHDFEQVFYVLSGEMNVEIDGEVFRAPAGSLIRFPPGTRHHAAELTAGTGHDRFDFTVGPLPDGLARRKCERK